MSKDQEKNQRRKKSLGPFSSKGEKREVTEGAQGGVGVFAVLEEEGVEAARLHRLQVVAHDVADRAQLALVAVALAQEPGDGEAAAVGKRGEVDFDAIGLPEQAQELLRVVVGLQTEHRGGLRRGLAREATVPDERGHRRGP